MAAPAYRAHEAEEQAWDAALRPKKCLLARNRQLREVVASRLILDWSPEQISGWLKTYYPDDGSMRVSHETIYRSLFIQARGVLKKELLDHLRSEATHASLATCQSQRTVPRTDRRCHLDPGKTRGGGRPSDSWSLGRGSAERSQEQLHGHSGRTSFALCHADQSAEQGNGSCRCCPESACP